MNKDKLTFFLKYRWLWVLLLAVLFATIFSNHNLQNFVSTALILYPIGLLFAYDKVRWLALFLLSLLPSFTTSFLLQEHASFSVVSQIVFWFSLIFAFICSYWIARKAEIIPKISLRNFPVLKILLGFLLLFTVSILAGMIGQLTKTTTTQNQTALNQLQTQIPFAIFAAQTILAGFFEELTYRVGVFEIVLKKYPKLAFIAATLLFAFMHGPTDLYSWVLYGCMSLVLTSFYFKYRNFYLNMSIHMLWNLFSIIVTFLLLR